MSEPRLDPLAPLYLALAEAEERDDCVCGGPKGHTGWLTCLDPWGETPPSGQTHAPKDKQ